MRCASQRPQPWELSRVSTHRKPRWICKSTSRTCFCKALLLPSLRTSGITLSQIVGSKVKRCQSRIGQLTIQRLGTTPLPAPRMTARPTWITLKALKFRLPRIVRN